MADKVTQTRELKMVAKFADGDTRTITRPNPKADISAADINNFAAVTKSTQAILGDKGGASFVSFGEVARVTTKKRTELDLR